MNKKDISDIVELKQSKIVVTCASCLKVIESPGNEDRCPDCRGLLLTTDSALTAGSVVDSRYEVIELIGEGAWGTVYRVRQTSLDRPLALKLMHRRLADDRQKVRRFQQEAMALRELHHSGIAAIYNFGVTDSGQPFLVQDFVEGSSLKDLIKSNTKLTGPQFKTIFSKVLDAVGAAHKQKLVHRDIKPENIIISADLQSATLVDFGISKFAENADSSLTATGELLGTPLYMSPEQCTGSEVDGRSDLYSLGCVMYHVLAGKPPFEADNSFNCMLKHVNEEPDPLPAYAAYQSFASKALSKNPDERFQSAAQMKEALCQLPDKFSESKERSRPLPLAWTAVLGCLLVVLVVVAIAASSKLPPQTKPTPRSETIGLVAPTPVPQTPRLAPEPAPTDSVDLLVTEIPTSADTELANAVASIHNTAEWLKQNGHAAEANDAEKELKAILDGKAPSSNAPELHAILIGSGRGESQFSRKRVADVEVNYTEKPFALCLFGTGEVTCNVRVQAGAKLTKIYALGCDVRLTGAKVPITSDVDMSKVTSALMQKDLIDFPLFKAAIEKADGKNLSALLTGNPGAKYVLGPKDPDWVKTLQVARLQPLLQKSSALERAELSKVAANFKFLALRHYIDSAEQEQSKLAQFNGLGALEKGIPVKVPSAEQVISTPEGMSWLIGDYYKLYSIDAKGNTSLVPFPEFCDGVEFGCYDPSSKTIIFSHPDGGISQLNPLTNTWKPLHPGHSTSRAGFVFSPEEKCFYTFEWPNATPGHIRKLVKLTLDGHVAKRIELDQPLWWYESHKGYQLRMHDGKIFALSGLLEIPGAPGPSGELYVIDPHNGHVGLTSTLPRNRD